MAKSSVTYQEYIDTLPISEAQKNKLRGYGASFEKDFVRIDFQLKRTLKDKSIVINLLNRSIDELRLQQKQTEQANIELLSQKNLVEAQSAKLSEQLQLLEKSYAELEQFSYIASHDLKSPLRTIASYAGLLKRRYSSQLDAGAIEFIDYIVKGASHMNEIIRDLLEYAGINKERQLEAVDTKDILQLVIQNLSGEILESGAEITTTSLPALHGYRTGLLQLFQNLIANSIKFRGEIRPSIKVQAAELADYWQFTVSDNGLGLDENFQEKAFLPFQRISHLDRPGTGMGLAICKKIVTLHQGDIWYKSKPREGTTFHFTISKSMANEGE